MPFAALDGVDATYICCSGGVSGPNETVKQPLAMEAWAKNISGLKVDVVQSMHCGFLEQKLVWQEAFARHLL